MNVVKANTSGLIAHHLEDSGVSYHCSKTLDEAFLVVYVVQGFTMFVGNTFCCAVFISTPRLRNCYMNIFLVSLGVAEILAALAVIPGHCAFCTSCSKDYVLRNMLHKQTCRVLDGVKDYIWLASILSLLGITYDRYLAVIQPLRYRSKMTARTVVKIMLITWFLPLPFSFVKPILNAVNVDFLKDGSHSESVFDVAVVTTLVIAPMAVLVIVNVSITKAIKKQLRMVGCRRMRRSPAEDFKPKETRAKTISCLIVILVFLVSWFPRSLLNFMFLFQIHHTKGLKLLEKISLVFLFFQSSINPFLYSFYRKDFRQAAKNLVRRMVPFKLRRQSSCFSKERVDKFSDINHSKIEPALVMHSVNSIN